MPTLALGYTGEQGPPGIQGSQGVPGIQGPAGADGAIIVAGQSSASVVKVTTDYLIGAGDHTILVDATAGPVMVTLPDATLVPVDHEFRVKKTDPTASAVTITARTGQTVDGGPDCTITLRYKALVFVGDGANWFVF